MEGRQGLAVSLGLRGWGRACRLSGGRVWLRWAAPLLILLAAFNALMYTVGPQFPIPALPTYNASGTGYWVISTATVLA